MQSEDDRTETFINNHPEETTAHESVETVTGLLDVGVNKRSENLSVCANSFALLYKMISI